MIQNRLTSCARQTWVSVERRQGWPIDLQRSARAVRNLLLTLANLKRPEERPTAAAISPRCIPEMETPHDAFESTERGRLAGRDSAALHIEQSCPGTGPVHPTWQFCRWSGRARDEQRPIDGRRRPMPAHWRLARRAASVLEGRLWRVSPGARAWLGDNRFRAGLLNKRGYPVPPAVHDAAGAPGNAFSKTKVVIREQPARRVD